jgi:hypothetical protein
VASPMAAAADAYQAEAATLGPSEQGIPHRRLTSRRPSPSRIVRRSVPRARMSSQPRALLGSLRAGDGGPDRNTRGLVKSCENPLYPICLRLTSEHDSRDTITLLTHLQVAAVPTSAASNQMKCAAAD